MPAPQLVGLFDPVVDVAKLSPDFVSVCRSRGYAPSRSMMDRIFAQLGDRDGNFREQFQSTGFDARTWELFLFAALTDAGNTIDLNHTVPDFVLTGHGHRWALEATTANPGPTANAVAPAEPGARQRYIEQELPIRVGSPLYSKLSKRYWERPEVAGTPFVLALQSFATNDSLTFSEAAVTEYLFGMRSIWERGPGGELVIHNVAIAEHRLEDKVIPSGFFSAPNAEHLAAILFSNQAPSQSSGAWPTRRAWKAAALGWSARGCGWCSIPTPPRQPRSGMKWVRAGSCGVRASS